MQRPGEAEDSGAFRAQEEAFSFSFLFFFFFESLNMLCLHVIKIWDYYIKWLQEYIINELFCILSFYVYKSRSILYLV